MKRLRILLMVLAASALPSAAQLTITTKALPNVIVGQQYPVITLQTSGAVGTVNWSIIAGTPPPGFVVGLAQVGQPATNGTFCFGVSGPAGPPICPANTGVSSPPGAYTFTIQATNQQTILLKTSSQFTVIVGSPVQITTQSLHNAFTGQPYSVQLQATGGAAAFGGGQYLWSVAAGSLPPNFTLDQLTGIISSTSVGALGSFNFAIQVSDTTTGDTATALFTIGVTLPLQILQTSLPVAMQGTFYQTSLTGSGGEPPYLWGLSGNAPGLFISQNTGVLSGNLSVGVYNITVTLQDSSGASIQQGFTLQVIAQALIITTTSLPAGEVGLAYSQTLAAAGGTLPLAWTVSGAQLPPAGLSLTAAGIIQGTPTVAGQVSFAVKVTDAVGQTAAATLSINVIAQLKITTTSLPDAILRQPYGAALVATGGVAPLTWSFVSGGLPVNLTLNSSTGIIEGTSNVSGGAETFTVKVTDALGATAQQTLTLNTVGLLTANLISFSFTGTVGVPFSQTLAALGGSPPYTWSVLTGTLPGGLQLNSATGAIAGTPNAAGTSNVVALVHDSGLQSAQAPITFTINPGTAPTVTIGVGTSTQPPVSVTLSSAFPEDINGTLTLSFASSVGGTDNMIRFTNGLQSLNFLIPNGTTSATFPNAPNAAVVPGTVAGTITLQVTTLTAADGTNLLPASPLTKTIVTNPAVPVITAVTLQQVSGGINVIVTGYSNTREVSKGQFHFTVSSGNTLSQSDITVALTSAYTTWFSNALASSTGGQFTLTQPFAVTQGVGTAVTGVQATLTNMEGPSAPMSSQ